MLEKRGRRDDIERKQRQLTQNNKIIFFNISKCVSVWLIGWNGVNMEVHPGWTQELSKMKGFPLSTLAPHSSLSGVVNGAFDTGECLLNPDSSCLGKSSPLLVVGSWCQGLRLFSLGVEHLVFLLACIIGGGGQRFSHWYGLGLLYLCTNLGTAKRSSKKI